NGRRTALGPVGFSSSRRVRADRDAPPPRDRATCRRPPRPTDGTREERHPRRPVVSRTESTATAREERMTTSPPGAASLDEALAFIAEHPHLYLLTRRADGYPTGYAMMSRVTRGTVSFSTYRASAKVQNLMREGVAG